MAGYVHGTSAYKYEEKRVPAKKLVRKTKVKIDMFSVAGFLVVAALAFLLLGRYSQITAKNAEIEALKESYEKVNSAVVKSEYELEKSIDLKKVEEIAITKLGMQRPEKHQLVYINMKNDDYCEVRVDTPNGGFLANTTEGIWGLQE